MHVMSLGCRARATKDSVYSPGAQPDAVRKNATRRGVHVIYEQKVASPISTATAGTSSVGAQAAFANTDGTRCVHAHFL